MALLSVVTITYNDILGLKATYNSLRDQEFSDFDWIVIDGGSTDGTSEFLTQNALVARWVSEPDGGIYDAMRKGRALAEGNFIWFLNAGDLAFSRDSTKVIASRLADNDVMYFSAMFDYGGRLARVRKPRDPISSVRYSVPGNQQATVYRSKVLTPDVFQHGFSLCGDYFMSAVLIRRGVKCARDDSVIARFAMGGASTVRVLELCKEAFIIQRQILGMGWFASCAYFVRRFLVSIISRLLFRVASSN